MALASALNGPGERARLRLSSRSIGRGRETKSSRQEEVNQTTHTFFPLPPTCGRAKRPWETKKPALHPPARGEKRKEEVQREVEQIFRTRA